MSHDTNHSDTLAAKIIGVISGIAYQVYHWEVTDGLMLGEIINTMILAFFGYWASYGAKRLKDYVSDKYFSKKQD